MKLFLNESKSLLDDIQNFLICGTLSIDSVIEISICDLSNNLWKYSLEASGNF